MDQVCLNTRRHRKTKALALFSIVVAFAFMFVVFAEVPVFATTIKVVDNDDAQGHTVDSYGTWTYMSANSLYYADARISTTGNSNYYYRYIFDHYVKVIGSTNVKLRVWLNHSDFDDTHANYRVANGSGFVYGYINQDTASAGWNIIFDAPYGSSGSTYYYTGVQVHPSTATAKHTGADAVEVTIG